MYGSLGDLTSLEICAGAGGQALGLEVAGFRHLALVEIDADACRTLSLNRPEWNVINHDLREFSASAFEGVDLVAGGVPCPPFSRAGLKLGELDERDLFPVALRLVEECRPRAVMLENVKGLLSPSFGEYRMRIDERFHQLGYRSRWKLIRACDFGVPQLRPRVVCVALRHELAEAFEWPVPACVAPPTVGEALRDLMAAGGWEGADAWAAQANRIAPTLVGGSKKHGGPDLGPTQARRAWAELGVDGLGIAAAPPHQGFSGAPKLTVPMAARIQGFPESWHIHGKKTSAYRQVGNALPPPVAHGIGLAIRAALLADVAYPDYEVAEWHEARQLEISFAST